MTWDKHERTALVDALIAAGPDAPTLCEGWTARHLAAHVVLRERRPWQLAGGMLPEREAAPEAGTADKILARAHTWTDANMAAVGGIGADAEKAAEAWERMLAEIVEGPGKYSPYAWAGERINTVEFFVHTEDVRRGAGDDTPRELPIELGETLVRGVLPMGRMRLRGADVGVLLELSDSPAFYTLAPPRRGHAVIARGEPGELVLFAFGRGRHADVTLRGADADIAAVTARLPVREG